MSDTAIEVGLEKGRSDDLLVLIRYLQAKKVLPASFVLREEEKATLPHQAPYLKIGSDVVSGTKTISLYLSSFLPKLLGLTNIEKAEVDQWLTFSNTTVKPALQSKSMKSSREFAKVLNEILLQRVYFSANFLTVSDLILYANLYAYMENLTRRQRFEVNNISRWFDLLQHTPGVDLQKPIIDIDLDDVVQAPAPKKAKETKEAEGKAKEAKADAKPEAKSEAKPEAKPEAAKAKAEGSKQEKPKAEKGGKPAAKEADDDAGDDTVNVSRLNLRVGRILEVEKHPDANSLFVEKIDVGEAVPRTVVSGLVGKIDIEEMRNRLVIVVANMKPASMRGVTSEAMVLCATSPDGAKTEFVDPPQNSKPGDRVFVEGYDGTADAVLNPKKKIFEKIQPDFLTSPERVATYKGKPFKTEAGLCTAKTVTGGSIK